MPAIRELAYINPASAASTDAKIRRALLANTTIYVRTTGNDSNSGLTSGAAFLTAQKAIDVIKALDFNDKHIILDLGAGAWNDGAGGPLILPTTVGEAYQTMIVRGAGSGSTTLTMWVGAQGGCQFESLSFDCSDAVGSIGLLVGEHAEVIIGDDVAFTGNGYSDTFVYDYGAISINSTSITCAGNKLCFFTGGAYARLAHLKSVNTVFSGTPDYSFGFYALIDFMLVANTNNGQFTPTHSGAMTGVQYYMRDHAAIEDRSATAIAGSLGVVEGGTLTAPPATKTANYTMTAADSSLIFNAAGSTTLTLLPAASFPGRWLTVKTIAAQTVVSASSNVVPLAGGSAGTAILAGTAGKWAMLQSNGTNWVIMAAA